MIQGSGGKYRKMPYIIVRDNFVIFYHTRVFVIVFQFSTKMLIRNWVILAVIRRIGENIVFSVIYISSG